MPTSVSESELRPGDVLLYQGDTFLSKLIRLFDGSEYSHASIWTGLEVIEAVAAGVVGRDLRKSIAGARFVHVYRFFDKDGHILGDDSSCLPSRPVLARAEQFKKQGERYAYEAIILLAILASTRRISAGVPLLRLILRSILDTAADVLARLVVLGKEPLICSELVYRCYRQAGSKYRVRIRGADLAGLVVNSLNLPPSQLDAEGFYKSAATFIAQYHSAKQRPMCTAETGAAAQEMAAVANFVTPGDLKRSPDLRYVGQLELEKSVRPGSPCKRGYANRSKAS